MRSIIASMVMCLGCALTAHAGEQAKKESTLDGDALRKFLENYVEVGISPIEKGHSISLRVPNAKTSDRRFFSIQLFLMRDAKPGEEEDPDVFEVTSGADSGDIDFLMNIKRKETRASYVVFREEFWDDSGKGPAKWVETTVRLADLLAARPPVEEKAAPSGGDQPSQ